MKYTRALARRRRALAHFRAARGELHASLNEIIDVYQAHPLPTLAGPCVSIPQNVRPSTPGAPWLTFTNS